MRYRATTQRKSSSKDIFFVGFGDINDHSSLLLNAEPFMHVQYATVGGGKERE
jgi:hypothetical protein